MANFFAELKRRHIYRVAAAYAVVAWVLLQIVNNVAPALRIPDWGLSLVLVLLLVGFPVALLFAWIHQLPTDSGALTHAATVKLDWALIGALVTVIALVSYEQFASGFGSRAVLEQQAGVTAARNASLNPSSAISVAVMPFANLSSDKEQEFFSDGMTEEITTALARIPDLRVVARESAFQFKGEKKDVRAVAQALGATHLIEGSVRRAGNRVRITAQLVKADDGVNVWANSYDRELTDVFAIQEDIARAIATSLRMPLGLKPGENLVSNRPADQATYDLYLRGRAALRARTRQELDLLEQVVARDPKFAPGWAMLSEARREMGIYFERLGQREKRKPLLEGAETAARKAIELDPNLASGYSSLAAVVAQRGKFVEAMELYKQGLARDPEDAELLNNYSATLRLLGYLREALEVKERLRLLEPLVPLYNRQRVDQLFANGKTDAGVSELVRLSRQTGDDPVASILLASVYAQQGRFAEAADTLSEVRTSSRAEVASGFLGGPVFDAAVQVLRSRTNNANPPAQLPDFFSELNFVYAYTATPERMLDWPEKAAKDGDYRPLSTVWWPTPPAMRKTERFKILVRNAGLVDYWRAHGWPDLCRPVGTDDFICD